MENNVNPQQTACDQTVRQQLEVLQADFGRLKKGYEEVARHREQLLKERDELNRRLNAALSNLATREGGTYSTAGAGQQHDQLVQTFRQLKTQHFQELTQTLYDHRRESARRTKIANRKDDVANIRALLANEILLVGSRLLTVRRGRPDDDLDSAAQDVLERLRRCLEKDWYCHLPGAVLRELEETVSKGLHLIRSLAAATPPATLYFPRKDAP